LICGRHRSPSGSTDPVVAATVRRAAQALADAGYKMEEVCPPRYEDAISCWARLIMGDLASVLGPLSQIMGADAMALTTFRRPCLRWSSRPRRPANSGIGHLRRRPLSGRYRRDKRT
jgi:hypothetical protein